MSVTDGSKAFGYIIDQETSVDLLRNEAIAKTVVDLVTAKSSHSVTVGVHGDWGAGKSSVLHMIEAAFANGGSAANPGYLCIRFNGWEFQGFEDAKIALIEGVVTQLIAKRPMLTKATDQVKNVLKRIDWLKIAKRGGGLAFNVSTGLPSPDQVMSLLSMFQAKIENPATFLTKENAEIAMSEMRGFWKESPDSRSVPEELREFHNAFEQLIEKAEVSRLIVLVDDLDRCLPETAIQTLEAIRLFVSLPKTAFVIGADESMIEYSVRSHFKDIPEEGVWKGYPKAYLEKLIQVPFRIPAMGETETHIYVTMLLVGALIEEDSQEFKCLLDRARELMSRPWERKGLEEADIRGALALKYSPDVARAVALADRISPVLAKGASGNPRQVKRFVNALNLRLRVSAARGFGQSIDPDVLVKFMLAETFLPSTVFDHIAMSAASSDDGISEDLALLEAAVRAVPAAEVVSKKGSPIPIATPEVARNEIVEDWKTQEDVARWARVDPEIGKLSLKPYLFVVNDRKNFVGTGKPMSAKLIGILRKLTGTSFAAASAKGDLGALEQTEVELVFGALRTLLLSEKALQVCPAAIGGLNALVTTHQSYQARYLEVLDMLPSDALGAWAGTGYDKVITTAPAKAKLSALFEKWRTKGGASLKMALEPMGSGPNGRS
ncbi:Qat anti-phage system ATPase QatA [Mesorhizobium sp. M0185]|uniref:Qat anti-phage system ATPase QatA n=1 Tax=Mesorhizobium sp. M0185 TaxID=2956907 RepID=UPI0033381A20